MRNGSFSSGCIFLVQRILEGICHCTDLFYYFSGIVCRFILDCENFQLRCVYFLIGCICVILLCYYKYDEYYFDIYYRCTSLMFTFCVCFGPECSIHIIQIGLYLDMNCSFLYNQFIASELAGRMLK